MADEKKTQTQPKTEVEQLRAELAEMRAVLSELRGAKPATAEKEPRQKATGTFRLVDRHYRLGRMYEAGELITIQDEVPGMSWVPYDAKAEADAAAKARIPAPVSSGRAADQSIG